MANGRFLSSSIAYDSRLNRLSLEAEYIYLKAIPHLDRDGLIQGDPALLFATVCPRRVDMISRIEDVINEWIALELVTRYDGWQEGAVLFFTVSNATRPGCGTSGKSRHSSQRRPATYAQSRGCAWSKKTSKPKPQAPIRMMSGITPAVLRHLSGVIHVRSVKWEV